MMIMPMTILMTRLKKKIMMMKKNKNNKMLIIFKETTLTTKLLKPKSQKFNIKIDKAMLICTQTNIKITSQKIQ